MRGLGWACLVLLLTVGTVHAQLQAPLVREIRIVNLGPGPLDEASVRSFIGSSVDAPYRPAQVNRDVRILLDTGRFSDVDVLLEIADDQRALDLIFQITNKPRLRSIRVEGADHVSNRRVRDWLELSIGDRIDDVVLAVHAQKVYENYRKRYFLNPQLTWTIDADANSGQADVRIQVDEGERARIRRIHFEGNESVSDRTLRRPMQQKRRHLFSRLTKSNRFDPYLLDADRDIIRRIYLNRGHLDVHVGQPAIETVGRNQIDIIVPVTEGPVYRIRSLEISGVEVLPQDVVEAGLILSAGDVASMGRIEEARSRLRDVYGSRGYIRTQVRPRLEPDFDEAAIDLEYTIVEGELSSIRDIIIRGNTRTRDKVIRRELAVLPGDVFDEVRVRRSENRLMNMGYFNHVRAYDQPTRVPTVYDLVFDVEEGRTGELIAGAGFSSIDRVIGFASIAQNNFDLLGWPHFSGGGQRVQLQTQFGARRTDVDLTFVEPWFLDRQLEFDINLFRRDSRFFRDDYQQRSIGGSFGWTWPVGRFSRLRASYSLEQIEIRNARETPSGLLLQEEGRYNKSATRLTFTRDTRDQFFIPTRGNRTVLLAEVAGGPLQGNVDTYRLEARNSYFYPIWRDHVFSLRGTIAVVDTHGDMERVPIFDRLFLGGMRDIRGFRFRDVGPKDEDGTPLGGNTSAFISAEYTVPVLPRTRIAAFYDIGQAWPDSYEFRSADLNSAYGVGIRFDLPGFPLRFDHAWPIETDEFNDRKSGRFSFMIGHVF